MNSHFKWSKDVQKEEVSNFLKVIYKGRNIEISQAIDQYYDAILKARMKVRMIEQRYKLAGHKMNLGIGVVDYNLGFKPMVCLYNVDLADALDNDTIKIMIPIEVECIDTSKWLSLSDEDKDSGVRKLALEAKRLEIVGNGRPLYGSLDRVGIIREEGVFGDSGDLQSLQSLERIEFKRFDGRNISSIQSTLQKDLNFLEYQNLDEIGLQKVSQISGNNFGVLKSPQKFLSSLDIQECNHLLNLFSQYDSEYIDVSGIRCKNVLSTSCMFCGNTTVRKISFGRDDGEQCGIVQKAIHGVQADLMFAGCTNLEEIPEGFGNIPIHLSSELFKDCKQLKKLNLRRLNFGGASIISKMFQGSGLSGHVIFDGAELSGVQIPTYNNRAILPDVTHMQQFFKDCDDIEYLEIKNLDIPNLFQASEFVQRKASDNSTKQKLTNVVISNVNFGINDNDEPRYRQQTFHRFFGHQENLREVVIENSEICNCELNNLFEGCKSLERIVLKNLKIGHITQSCEMFKGCSKLKEIIVENVDVQPSVLFIPSDMDDFGLYEIDTPKDDSKLEFQLGVDRIKDMLGTQIIKQGIGDILLNLTCKEPKNFLTLCAYISIEDQNLQVGKLVNKLRRYGYRVEVNGKIQKFDIHLVRHVRRRRNPSVTQIPENVDITVQFRGLIVPHQLTNSIMNIPLGDKTGNITDEINIQKLYNTMKKVESTINQFIDI